MRRSSFLFALSLSLFAGNLQADDMPEIEEIVQVQLLSGWHVAADQHIGALQVTLAPGWKTYWRAAGQNGFPPTFHWEGSQNIRSVAYHWPRPQILTAGGETILGYEHELVLPIQFHAALADTRILAAGHVDLGVCKEVCIPVRFAFSTELASSDPETRFLIELALGDQPNKHGAEARCRISPLDDGYRLQVRLDLPAARAGGEIAAVEVAQPDVWVSSPELRREGRSVVVTTDVMSYDGAAFDPDLSAMRLTIVDQQSALELTGCTLTD